MQKAAQPEIPPPPPGFNMVKEGSIRNIGLEPGFASLANIKRGLTKLAYDVVPVAAGAATGALGGAPAGPLGVVGGALLGGGGGEALKQLYGHAMRSFGVEPPTPPPTTGIEAALDVGTAGLYGIMGEAPKAFQLGSKVGKAIAPSQPPMMGRRLTTEPRKLASEFNVPLTPAQQTQSKATSSLEALLRKSLSGSGIFRDFDLLANKRLIEAGQKIGRAISSKGMSDVEAGKFIQSALSKADELSGINYETVVDRISKQGGSTTLIPVGNIVAVAKKLLKELKGPTKEVPSLRGVESLNKSIGILEDFANLERKVSAPKQVLKVEPDGYVFETLPGAIKPKAAISWAQARLMRSLLFKISRTGEVDIGKGAISQITAAVDDAMTKGLEQAGRKDLAQQFRGASNRFRTNSELLKTSTMEAIARSDKPGLVLDILKQDPTTGIRTFRRLAHSQPGVVEAVERKLWEEVFESAQREGVLIGNSLERHLDKELGEEAVKAIWGSNSETLAKVKRFAKLADTMSLRSSLTRPMSDQPQSLLAMGQGALAATALVQAGRSVLHQDYSGFALNLGAFGMVIVGPYQLAKAMTSPRSVEMLTQALKTPAASSAGVKLGIRLAAALGLGATKKDDIPELWPAH